MHLGIKKRKKTKRKKRREGIKSREIFATRMFVVG
jgi:hypothetical protein